MKPFKKKLRRLEDRRKGMRTTWETLRRNPKVQPEKAYRMPGSMNK